MSDASPELVSDDRRKQTVWEVLDALGNECRRGHRDLRKTTNELEAQADALEKDLKQLATDVRELAAAPVEATKIRFSTGVMVAVVAATVSVVGAAYGIGNRVMGRIDTFESRMDRQSEDDKRDRASLAKLLDERNARSEKSIDSLARQVELLKYEQQRLREDVTGKGGRRP